MNNTLYHFGDSFGKAENYANSFGIKIANHYGLKYLDFSDGGLSNDQILQKMLNNLDLFKRADVILINFSYLSRFFTLNPNLELTSTAKYFDDNSGRGTDHYESFYQNRETLLDYFLNYNYEYNIKLFTTINSLLNGLKKRGVEVYSVLLKKDSLFMDGKEIKSNEYSFNLPNEVKFNPTYYEWLVDRGWKNEEEGHYTKGIQDELASEYIKRIDIIRNNKKLI
jgi:hypothetical protein